MSEFGRFDQPYHENPIVPNADGSPVIINQGVQGEPIDWIDIPWNGGKVAIYSYSPGHLISVFQQVVGPMPTKPEGMQGGDIQFISNYSEQTHDTTTTAMVDPGVYQEAALKETEWAKQVDVWTTRFNMLMGFAMQLAGLKQSMKPAPVDPAGKAEKPAEESAPDEAAPAKKKGKAKEPAKKGSPQQAAPKKKKK